MKNLFYLYDAIKPILDTKFHINQKITEKPCFCNVYSITNIGAIRGQINTIRIGVIWQLVTQIEEEPF